MMKTIILLLVSLVTLQSVAADKRLTAEPDATLPLNGNSMLFLEQWNGISDWNTRRLSVGNLKLDLFNYGSLPTVVNVGLDANGNLTTNAAPIINTNSITISNSANHILDSEVKIATLVDNQVLTYVASTGRWTNKNNAAGSGPWASSPATGQQDAAGFNLINVGTLRVTNQLFMQVKGGGVITVGTNNPGSTSSGQVGLYGTNSQLGTVRGNAADSTDTGLSITGTNVNSVNQAANIASFGGKQILLESPVVITNTAFANSGVSNLLTVMSASGSTVVQSDGSTFLTQLQYTTNSGAGVAPDFSKGFTLLQTNATFTVLLPLNVDSTKTKVQTTVYTITNSSGSLINVVAPSNVHSNGVWNVTNITEITFRQYGGKYTNAVAQPIW